MKKALSTILISLIILMTFSACNSTLQKENHTADIKNEIPDNITEITYIKVHHLARTMYIKDEETIENIYEIIKALDGKCVGNSKGYYGASFIVNGYTDTGRQYRFALWDNTRYTIGSGVNGEYPDFYEVSDDSLLHLYTILNEAFIEFDDAPVSCTVIEVDCNSNRWEIGLNLSNSDVEGILAIFDKGEWASDNVNIGTNAVFKVKDGGDIHYEIDRGILFDESNQKHLYLSTEDKAFIDGVLKVGE